MESREPAKAEVFNVAGELERMHPGEAAKAARESFSETLAHAKLPHARRHRIRANNIFERLIAGTAGRRTL